VAVLPFSNLAGEKDDYFSDGLTEEVQDALSRVNGLRVVASTSAGPLKKQGMDIRDLGQRLNVSSVLEGSVRREGQNVRVSARLVGTADSSQIWSHTYSGETASIFRVQQEIARGIAEALQGRLSQANLTRLQTIGTRDEEAHDLHLSGVWLLERARSPEQQRQAVNYLERASVKDPKYAAPLAVLSQYHSDHTAFDPLSQSKALALATRAVSLADDCAEAHLALANVLASSWEWTRAEREFRRAISLQPSYWEARADFARFLVWLGRFGEASKLNDEAEGLSPLDVETQCMKGTIAYFEQRWDVALPYLRRRHEIDPDYNIVSQRLAKTLFRTGQTAESIALLKSQIIKVPREDARYRYAIRDLGYIYGRIHDLENARAMLVRLRELAKTDPVPSIDYALIHAGMGDRDMAFKYLEQSHREHSSWMLAIKVEPMFDTLRDDPRFADLVRRVGL
jgi:TolB-like protein/Flp pilus assembly protein TadD